MMKSSLSNSHKNYSNLNKCVLSVLRSDLYICVFIFDKIIIEKLFFNSGERQLKNLKNIFISLNIDT
jgi:hypothetical protein